MSQLCQTISLTKFSFRKVLLGQPLEKVVNREAMANPGCLDWHVALARQSQA